MGQRLTKLVAAAALLLAGFASYSSPAKAPLELWYWHHSYLVTDAAVQSSKALIDRAARCGYTGVAFWDNSFGFLGDSAWPPSNVQRLHAVMQYAVTKGLRVLASGAPFGWSNIALIPDGNLAEAQRVIGAQFQVDPHNRQLRFLNSLPALRNSGFEEGKTAWFDTGDAAIGLNQVAHSGKFSAAIVDASANARFRQRVNLTPWRQYHLSLWFQSNRFHGPAAVEVLDWWHRKVNRFYTEIPAEGTHAWTRLDYTFDSRDSNWAYLYFGVWGSSSGILRFDDIELEETAPVYVTRRAGAPLSLYDPVDRHTVYQEGADFDRVFDPALSPPRAVFRDGYHPPITIRLPASTRLRPGQTVALDFHAVFPIPPDNQVGMCLTAPGVFEWLRSNAQALQSILPPGSPVLLGYDEMRQVNSCARCRARELSAGQLLAWNVQQTAHVYQSALPGSPLYVWNDMFDPFHNAHNHYFYVEGNLAGSWAGLSAEVGVLNWNHTHLRQSLEWFAGMNARQPLRHEQIIASYYDSGKGSAARDDLLVARGIPGIQGIMYVTWRDDYSQLESFAASARSLQ